MFGKTPGPAFGSQGSHAHLASPRSGHQHKAWGVSPRIDICNCAQPTEWATAVSKYGVIGRDAEVSGLAETASGDLSPASRATAIFSPTIPGLTPGFMLARAPRAPHWSITNNKKLHAQRDVVSLRVEPFLTTTRAINILLLAEQKPAIQLSAYFFRTNVTRTGSLRELAGTSISIVLKPLAFTFSFSVPM